MEDFPFVRIRRKMRQTHNGKDLKRYQQLELTIPSRFKELVEPFIGKDLIVDMKCKDNRIFIEAKRVDASC